VSTVPVPSANDFVVRDDGRIYVAGFDKVSVVNPNGQTVATVTVPDLCAESGCWGSAGGLIDVAINPAGTRLYAVREYYTDSGMFSGISLIDTATNALVNTAYANQLSEVEVSPDGKWLYGAEGDYRYIPVLDAATLAGAGSVNISAPGEWPYVANLSVRPDGKRAYAIVGPVAWAPYQDTVSIAVIDTDPASAKYNTQIASIALPGARDIAFSPDSTRAYVLMNDGKTVRVINTSSNAVVGYFSVAAANNIAVGSNGTVYLTNSAAGIVYAVSVGGSGV
jgi:DNA-binding beta-propeller fold protein YncE